MNQIEGLRYIKITIRGPFPGLERNHTTLNRREVRIATGLITRHFGLRKHLRTIGIFRGDPSVRLCGVEEESATHIIFSCEALATRRFDLFEDGTLPEETFW